MAESKKIVIVEDDEDLRNILVDFLSENQFEVLQYSDSLIALEFLAENHKCVGLVISDLRMPQMDGLEFLTRLKELDSKIPLIMITGYGSLEIALEAMKRGAFHYMMKPFKLSEILIHVQRAFDFCGARPVCASNSATANPGTFVTEQGVGVPELIGKSPAMKNISDLILRVSKVNTNVLIRGESGTGKEMVARAIHQYGPRHQKPFVAINCAAIPDTLLESELFGYARGAFTGATQRKQGLIEDAEGGTLFLDEIGDMPPGLQSKLLRVIQERKIRAVGDNKLKNIDIRIITATHVNLQDAIKQGKFREDLYYRLSVIPISLPPLRERREDIPLLSQHFLKKYASLNNFHITGFTRAAMARLMGLRWDGNVRELENVIERAVALCTSALIDEKDLLSPSWEFRPSTQDVECPGFGNELDVSVLEKRSSEEVVHDVLDDFPTMEELEKRYIRMVLEKTRGRKDEAAKVLGINRRTLYRKEREYHLN